MDSRIQWACLALALPLQLTLFLRGARRLAGKFSLPGVFDPKPSLVDSFFVLLALALFADLAGVPGLWVGRALFTALILAGLLPSCERIDWREWIAPSILCAAFFAIWTAWLAGLACLPSLGDGIHHLHFYYRIRETGRILVGQVPLLHADLFGAQRLPYYPSGFHASAAIATFPASALLKTRVPTELQVASIELLAAFPAAMYLGFRRWARDSSGLPVFLASVWVGTLVFFPVRAVGEGGISRVAGQIIAVPLVWGILAAPFTPLRALFLSAIAAPILFWIHPSALVVAGAAAALRFVQSRREGVRKLQRLTLFSLLGLALGGIFAWLLLRSGWSDAAELASIQSWLPSSGLSAHSILDRLQGPAHLLFSEGAGFGRFLSPRSLVFYGGLVLALRSRAHRPTMLLFLLLPFGIALLALTRWAPTLLVGAVFYHQAERIAEIGFWPLFIGWAIGLGWLCGRGGKWVKAAAAVGAIAVSALALGPLSGTLDYFNGIYASPTRQQNAELLARFEREDKPGKLWVCESIEPQMLLYWKEPALDSRLVIMGSDCLSPTSSRHCALRAKFIEKARSELPRSATLPCSSR